MTTLRYPAIVGGFRIGKRHLQHPTRRDAAGRAMSFCSRAARPDLLTTNAAEVTCGTCRSSLYGWRVKEAH